MRRACDVGRRARRARGHEGTRARRDRMLRCRPGVRWIGWTRRPVGTRAPPPSPGGFWRSWRIRAQRVYFPRSRGPSRTRRDLRGRCAGSAGRCVGGAGDALGRARELRTVSAVGAVGGGCETSLVSAHTVCFARGRPTSRARRDLRGRGAGRAVRGGGGLGVRRCGGPGVRWARRGWAGRAVGRACGGGVGEHIVGGACGSRGCWRDDRVVVVSHPHACAAGVARSAGQGRHAGVRRHPSAVTSDAALRDAALRDAALRDAAPLGAWSTGDTTVRVRSTALFSRGSTPHRPRIE